MFKFVHFLLVLSSAAVLGEFPSDVTRCHRGDDACFTKTTREVVKRFPSGLRDLHLLAIDPMHVPSMALERNPSSPVNLELNFKNMDVIGLSSAQVKYVKGFNFNERSVLEALVPELLLKGDYTANGQVLILPIIGKGKSVITCTNILLKYSFDLKPFEKQNKTYAELEHVKLEFKPELVQYHFENLFNNDKALGDNMNKFLNENWRDIYDELEGGFATALSLIVKNLINNVLRKYPYDYLFSKAD